MLFREAKTLAFQIKGKNMKKSTLATYERMWEKYIDQALGDYDVMDIDRKHITDFVETLKARKLSNHTIQDYVVLVKSILNTLEKHCDMNCPNTRWTLELPKEERIRKLNRMSDTDARKLIDYCKNHPSNLTLALLVVMSTGLRIGEMSALRFEDFDPDTKTLSIDKTLQRVSFPGKKSEIVIGSAKTESSHRIIPVVGFVAKKLKAFSNVACSNYYIASGTPHPIEPRTLRNAYYRVCEELGIKGVTFHGMRHTFASLMIHKGMDVKTVSSILGHSSTSITMDVYCNPTTEEQREAVGKVFGRMMK